jgi:YidC/Oxa1 family membrane protein insertase
MMMDRKTILALLACVLVFVGGQFLISHFFPPVKAPTPPVSTNLTTTATVAATNVAHETKTVTAPPSESSQSLPPEQFATLQNDFIRVKLTSWGGGIRSVELLKYNAAQGGLVTLNGDSPEPSLALVGDGGTNTAYDLAQSSPTSIVMRAHLPGGAEVVKSLTLGKDYIMTGSVSISKGTEKPVQLVVGAALPAEEREGVNYLGVDWLAATYQTRTFAKISKKISKGESSEKTSAQWLGVKDQFFALIVTPATDAVAIEYGVIRPPRPSVWKGKNEYEGATGVLVFAAPVSKDASWSQDFSVYAGPKEYGRLAALGKGQEYLMDFGMFKLIAVWLLQSMLFLHKVIPNYGVVIILITIAIKAIFWPLSAKQMKSMKEMQKFQPMMAKLKEKYKDDPKRQQQEMMRLYKEHKINPLSGCLPMLVQIPVFFALFAMLRSAVELRGASFLWVKDLSQPDTVAIIPGLGGIPFFGLPGVGLPINPLPLLMTATTFWQQKISPTTADSQQAKMMMFMPLFMLVILYNYSSGLALYWTVQQLLSIGQQWWSLRKEPQPVPVTVSTRKSK